MVYFTSNLAIDGMLAYILIGSSLRKKFLSNNWTKAIFLLANIFAIVSDFDVFFGLIFGFKNHRGLSHSIFFPFIFIIIGMILLFYNRIRSKNTKSSLHDPDALFSTNDNIKGQILYLLPYFFILISFYMGMHIILDMDSAEGGMMLLWPFDDRLYQISINFLFSPYPFLLLPWTPLGASFSVQQSNISGLFNYLFNWTPQQLINYYHSTVFEYVFVGLILNIFLVVLWLYFVVKPFWPLEGKHVGQKLDIFSIFTKLHSYWKHITKEILVPGLILIIIGFTLGPLITPQVTYNQPINNDIEFTGYTFNGFSYIPLDAISQPFDPNAQYIVSVTYNLTNVQTGDELYFVIASNSFFTNLGQKISETLSAFNSNGNLTTDTVLKSNYLNNVDSLITNQSTIYYQVQKTNLLDFTYSFNLPSKNSYGIGFVLKNWVSTTFLNETNTQLFLNGNTIITYTRNVNYWIGMSIQAIGMFFVVIALVLPFKKRYPNNV